jgi:hypothetical protein
MEGFGTLAQLVEQRTFNPLVGGSSPPRPTKNKKMKSQALPGFFAFRTRVFDSAIHLNASVSSPYERFRAA